MSAAESYIFFELAATTYAVRSREVLHVDMLEHITPVPNSPPWIDGVVFSRGAVIPAVNLRTRFALPPQDNTARTRLLFVRHDERTVALIVDSAREFRTIPDDAIRPLADTLAGANGGFVSGVATINGRLVLLLDVAAVLHAARSAPEHASRLQPSA